MPYTKNLTFKTMLIRRDKYLGERQISWMRAKRRAPVNWYFVGRSECK